MSEIFYEAFAQAVLLFRAETWVLTLRMERGLDSFQHRVAQPITRRQPMRRGVVSVSTRHWRRQWGNWDLRVSKSLSRVGRTWSHSILRRDQFWTSVSRPLGGCELGCLSGGGSRLASTWRRRRQGRKMQRHSWSWSWTRNRTRTQAERRNQEEQAGQVMRIGVGRKSNPPRRTTGRNHGRGNKVVAKIT